MTKKAPLRWVAVHQCWHNPEESFVDEIRGPFADEEGAQAFVDGENEKDPWSWSTATIWPAPSTREEAP